MDYSFDFTALTSGDALAIQAAADRAAVHPMSASELHAFLVVLDRYAPVDLLSVPFTALGDVLAQAAAAFRAYAAACAAARDATPEADRLLGNLNLDELLD